MSKYFRLFLSALLIIACVGFFSTANAQENSPTIIIGAATIHFDNDEDYNNLNYMLGVEQAGWNTLVFRNSYNNNTLAVGKTWYSDTEPFQAGIMLNAMWGYEQEQTLWPCIGSTCLLVAPYVRITYWPIQPIIVFGGDFASIAFSYDF